MTHPYQNDPTEFPGGVNPFPTLTFTPHTSTASFLALNQVSTFDPNYKWPFTYQINFGFQQQLGNSFALSANYVGSLNRDLPLYTDLNAPIFNINPTTGLSGPSCFTTPGGTIPDTTKACGYANIGSGTTSTVNNRRPLNSEYRALGGIAHLLERIQHPLEPELQLQRPAGNAREAPLA